jgi:hypothetical protein
MSRCPLSPNIAFVYARAARDMLPKQRAFTAYASVASGARYARMKLETLPAPYALRSFEQTSLMRERSAISHEPVLDVIAASHYRWPKLTVHCACPQRLASGALRALAVSWPRFNTLACNSKRKNERRQSGQHGSEQWRTVCGEPPGGEASARLHRGGSWFAARGWRGHCPGRQGRGSAGRASTGGASTGGARSSPGPGGRPGCRRCTGGASTRRSRRG